MLQVNGEQVVHDYSWEVLRALICKYSGFGPPGVAKGHLLYLEQYLDHPPKPTPSRFPPRTVIVEPDYVDKDYLEDYSLYYVKCYRNHGIDYKRFCTRLHLFGEAVDDVTLRKLLIQSPAVAASAQAEKLKYIGFIVIRPLPEKFIGRTCLIPYEDNGLRHYQAIHEYNVNLYGINLVLSTLAYQEQDGVVGACATSALWVCFQQTAHLFQHASPKPVEISNNAIVASLGKQRALPSPGMNIEQVAQAVRNVGLEPDMYNPRNLTEALVIAYAYLKCNIPILASVPLYDINDIKPLVDDRKHLCLDKPEMHAVAITGYALKPGCSGMYKFPSKNGPERRLQLMAAGVKKLYAHDDQVGPFARLLDDGGKISTIKDATLLEELKVAASHNCLEKVYQSLAEGRIKWGIDWTPSLATSWGFHIAKIPNGRFGISSLIIPVDRKIRISFDRVVGYVSVIDEVLNKYLDEIVRPASEGDIPRKYTWDIYLNFSNCTKHDIRLADNLSESEKLRLLLAGWPKYVWRACAMTGTHQRIELIFDATELDFSDCLIHHIDYDIDFCVSLKLYLKKTLAARTIDISPQYQRMLMQILS